MSLIRLQKAMADKGLCSRREAERHIEAGRVKVNGELVTTLGTKVDPDVDQIEFDVPEASFTTILFHKPRGIMSNCPEPGQKEILDLLPKDMQDLSTVGRLDRDSEGLILLTNDGRIARHYLDADEPHEREYIVWLNDELSFGQKKRLESGVQLSGQQTKPVDIEYLDDTDSKPPHTLNPSRGQSSSLIRITMREGKNRQIRRMMQKVDIRVRRLMRTRFDNYTLDGLEPGQWRKI